MKENNSFIIIFVILIMVLTLIYVIFNNKQNSSYRNFDNKEYKSNIQEAIELKNEQVENIKNAFTECFKDYQEAKTNYEGYKMRDFVNATRLNMVDGSIEVEFIQEDAIDIEKAYSIEGYKLETLPITIYNGQTVKIEKTSDFEARKYYLIRVPTGSIYTNYYIITISANGKVGLEWYCYTENEILDEQENIDMELDLEDELLENIY